MATSFQSIFKSRLLIHITGWIIFFIAPLLFLPPNEFASNISDTGNLESMAIRNSILIILFYFNLLYLTPVLLKKQGVGIFLVVLISAVIMVSLVNWQIHHVLSDRFRPEFDKGPMPNFGFGPPRPEPMSLSGPLFSSFLVTIMIASISTSLVLWNDWVKGRAEEQERALQKLASELAVLKLQISPHFLFNTLNNIRWLVRSKSDQAEEAVMKLSQILRYILYQTDQDKILLDKEVENLRDYISLQKMRLSGQQNLTFAVTGETGNKRIVPLLFIPIIENFFKYGDFDNSSCNKVILALDGDHLKFQTENRIIKSPVTKNKEESGIGLANIRKRLELHYPDRHQLTYSEIDGIFALNLEIFLND
ncbi:MAG TPA: histidine kinase [Cyclobacteriaceae bacterium]|nr:histidine kinase [Cyclobacteriaceae bacterium]